MRSERYVCASSSRKLDGRLRRAANPQFFHRRTHAHVPLLSRETASDERQLSRDAAIGGQSNTAFEWGCPHIEPFEQGPPAF